METAYNILHLSGAFCLMVFSATGFALIIRWWNRLAIMEAQIRFIFEIQNELLLKSSGQVPKRSHFPEGFFVKTPEIETHVDEKKERREIIHPYVYGSGSLEPKGVINRVNENLPQLDNPPQPPQIKQPSQIIR